MSTWVAAWLIGTTIVGGGALMFGLIVLVATAGMRDRSDSRLILGTLAVVPLSPLWPLAVALGVTVGLPLLLRGLWSEADLPTPAERRRIRRQEAAAAADARVQEQQRYIERLEREAGIR